MANDDEVQLRDAAAAFVRGADAPVGLARIREALARSEKVVRATVKGLVASGALHEVKDRSGTKYTARDPDEAARQAILRALEEGPLAQKKLAERATALLEGFGKAPVERALKSMRLKKELFVHPRRGNFHEKIGAAPPDPGLYITTVALKLRDQAQRLRDSGVSDDAILAVVLKVLGIGAAPPAPKLDDAGDEASLLRALADLTAQDAPGALVSIARLRALRPLAKERFDRAMLRLRDKGQVTLHHHDFAMSLPPDERNELVQDDRGVHYVGAVLRSAP